MLTTLKNFISITSLSCIAFTMQACGPSTAQDDDRSGFQVKDDVKQTSELVGQALNAQNQPVVGATVYLLRAEEVVQTTTTNNQGQYRFEGDIVGQLKVVINTGLGTGGLIDITILAGGKNTADPLIIGPLEEIKELVDIAGVGFEERVTKHEGNYQYPVYNKDASRVFAIRKKSSEDTWTMVQIETATGQETTLIEKSKPFAAPHLPPIGKQALYLHHDNQIVFFERKDYKFYAKIFDTTTQKLVFDAQDVDLQAHDYTLAWSSDAHIHLLLREDIKSLDSGFEYKIKHKLVSYNVNTKKVQIHDIDSGWAAGRNIMGVTKDTVVFSKSHLCFNEQGDNQEHHCIERGQSIHHYNIVTNTQRTIIPNIYNNQKASSDGRVVVIHENASQQTPHTSHAVDTSNGQRTSITWPTLPPNTSPNIVTISQDGTKAVATVYVQYNPHVPEHYFLDFANKTITQLKLTATHEGQTQPICVDGEVWCTMSFDDDGALLVRTTIGKSSDKKFAVWIDDVTGPKPKTTVHPMPNVERYNQDVRALKRDKNPTQDEQALIYRNLDTGFSQLHVGHTSLTQRTFIRADHNHAKYASDGNSLFYFTTDPISGYTQLFRLQMATP